MDKPVIVVIDDHPLTRQSLEHLLQDEFRVLTAHNGAAGVALCKRLRPDLVLMDLELGDMDGIEACSRLKADPATADVPVIMVTGHTGAAIESMALGRGAVDFVPKPVHREVLLVRVQSHVTIKRQTDQLRGLAFRDALTGLYNRRRFEATLERVWADRIADGRALSVSMVDVDCFKSYNDHHGHRAGDDVLARVGGVLAQALRRSEDHVCRFGGEEFVCIEEGAQRLPSCRVGERIRWLVESAAIPHPTSRVASVVTVSVGVAMGLPADFGTIANLIATADQQLYLAKRAGRNQVSCNTACGIGAGRAVAF